MAHQFACSQGHSWSSEDAGGSKCPVCGEFADSDEMPATLRERHNDLPPPPRQAKTPVPASTQQPESEYATVRPGEWPRIAGFEIEGVLGRGGMGVVYRARQLSLGRAVALKMVLTGIRLHDTALARFRSEAQTLARVQHPNIVHIYDVMDVEGSPCIAMEMVEGGSLDRRLHKKPMPPREAAALVRTLARAVHAAHERGVIHRDLKPANILIAADGTPKITDFGLAKRLDEANAHTRTGDVMGTPHYMAPEQAEGTRDVGPAADVYALGAILYEALTGDPPFRGASAAQIMKQVLFDEPSPPSRAQPSVPPRLDAICLRCLGKTPETRFQTARALADDLDHFLSSATTDTPPPPSPPPRQPSPVSAGSRPKTASKRPIVVAAIVLLLLVGALAWAPGVRERFFPPTPDNGPSTPHWEVLAAPRGATAIVSEEAFDRVAFPTRKTGYLASRTSLYKTKDGGQTWTAKPLQPPGRVNVLHFTDENHGWLGSDRLRHTKDGGNTWIDVPLGGVAMKTITAFAVQEDGAVLCGGTTHDGRLGIFVRPDRNAPWTQINTTGDMKNHGNWFAGSLLFTAPGTALAVLSEGTGGGGAVFRTHDAGRSWTSVLSADDDLFAAAVPSRLGWLTGFGGAFWQTMDGGATFQPLDMKTDGATPTCLAFDPSGTLGLAPLWKGKVLLRIGDRDWAASDTPLGYALPHATVVDAGCGYVLGADGRLARLTLR